MKKDHQGLNPASKTEWRWMCGMPGVSAKVSGFICVGAQNAGTSEDAVVLRRPTKVFEDGINLMHLNYLLAFDGIIASRGGIPLIDRGVIDQGVIIGAIGCSGGTDSQDEVVSKAGAAVVNKVPARIK